MAFMAWTRTCRLRLGRRRCSSKSRTTSPFRANSARPGRLRVPLASRGAFVALMAWTRMCRLRLSRRRCSSKSRKASPCRANSARPRRHRVPMVTEVVSMACTDSCLAACTVLKCHSIKAAPSTTINQSTRGNSIMCGICYTEGRIRRRGHRRRRDRRRDRRWVPQPAPIENPHVPQQGSHRNR